MQKIASSKKYQNGIQVFWADKGNDISDFFSYEELIDMKINALDLLNNPAVYQVDAGNRKIQSTL